ncbi:MAG: ABC transporter permease [Gemmatimonas sp.]|uniref:ABC transporter permease n=1 Tax=Gemmatimonas sp. TaxID=1962908 RepID=UPI00391FAB66
MADPTPGRWRAFSAIATFALRAGIEALSHNALRAGLTSLGILFGVASVIAMLAIGRGAEQEILAQMRLLGSNNIIVRPIVEQKDEAAQAAGEKQPRRYTPGLTARDGHSIGRIIPEVEKTSGEIVLNTLITREGRRRSGKLVGVDTAYFALLNLDLADGHLFTPPQINGARPVAIIVAGVKARFFTTENPIGRTIKVGENWLTVVGVLADRTLSEQTAQRLGIRDANLDVYVPMPTMLLRYRDRARISARDIEQASSDGEVIVAASTGSSEDTDRLAEKRNYHQLDRLIVRVREAEAVTTTADVVRRMLERRHNNVVDFEITVPEELLRQEQRTRTIFNLVLSAIASISLIVGGIGIMNIMLASVLERIREIGVRRALGATQREILAQFLAEAMLISLAGGVAGILVGGALSFGIERVADIRTIVSALSVIVAFGVSITVGLVFGILPAWRAARQDPVVCLRYE